MSHIVTLTTDLGLKDHYVAVIKGELLKLNFNLKIVDVSHLIKDFDYVLAAELVKKTYKHFPEQSIHIIGLTFLSTKKHPILLVKYNNHFFIGQDNGMFSFILDNDPELIIQISGSENFNVASPLNEYLCAVDAIINNFSLEKVGLKVDSYSKKTNLVPFINKEVIRCQITQVDNFENVITNLSKEQFEKNCGLRKFTIFVGGYSISTISEYYDSVAIGDLVAFFNSENYLELAINTANIKGLLGLNNKTEILIQFE